MNEWQPKQRAITDKHGKAQMNTKEVLDRWTRCSELYKAQDVKTITSLLVEELK